MTEDKKNLLIYEAYNLLDKMKRLGASTSEISEQVYEIEKLESTETRPY